jgi:hypothetical protein
LLCAWAKPQDKTNVAVKKDLNLQPFTIFIDVSCFHYPNVCSVCDICFRNMCVREFRNISIPGCVDNRAPIPDLSTRDQIRDAQEVTFRAGKDPTNRGVLNVVRLKKYGVASYA